LAAISALPPSYDATALLTRSVGRSLQGFGDVTPIKARGGDKIPSDLYGLHQEEILRQRPH
jgi:hypothetical protein